MRALEVLGPAVRIPGARARPQQSALRGDHQVLRVRMQRFGDELLVHVRAVAVGGVEEIEAQLDTPCAARRCAAARSFGGPQMFGAADAHRAEAEAVDGQVADADGGSHARSLD